MDATRRHREGPPIPWGEAARECPTTRLGGVPTTPQTKEGKDMGQLHENTGLLTYAKERAMELFGEIPAQVVRDGARVDWGAPGAKARAVYIAALLGHQFDPHCNSCESDLYIVIKNAAK